MCFVGVVEPLWFDVCRFLEVFVMRFVALVFVFGLVLGSCSSVEGQVFRGRGCGVVCCRVVL